MTSIRSYVLRCLLRRLVNWNKPVLDLRNDLDRMKGRGKLPRGMVGSSVSIRDVAAEWLVPEGSPNDTAILYLHGGGFCLGIVNANRNFVARMAQGSGIRVLLPDFRLAPEYPYPAAFDDALCVYTWMLGEGYASRNIVLMGDSSGAGLCLSIVVALRDRGMPLPGVCVCLCPVTDLQGTGASLRDRAAVDPYALKDPLALVRHYVGNHDPSDPYLSPLYADLTGLPPMLVHASVDDVFLDDATRFVEKARHAGVDVTFKVWENLWHIFHLSADILPEGKRAVQEVCNYLHDRM